MAGSKPAGIDLSDEPEVQKAINRLMQSLQQQLNNVQLRIQRILKDQNPDATVEPMAP
jgi:exonuclease VII small subunit